MSSMHAPIPELSSDAEKLFVVLDPNDTEHLALKRAIITAQLREPQPRLHVFIAVDPDGKNGRTQTPQNLLIGEHWLAEHIRQPLAEKNLMHEIEFSWSNVWLDTILDAARRFGPDIILLPVHERSRRPLRLSERKWGLLKRASSPVLLVRPGAEAKRRTILAAVNFQATTAAQKALNQRILMHAGRISQRYDAELHVVNAYFDSMSYPSPGDLIKKTGLPWERIHIDQGYTDEVVARVAERIDADILTLGTLNQKGGQGSFRRGNTASRVIDAVDIDTLIVN
ncbi:universal stress protein [Marinimicrobium alkaliphilum]|uniref:universal stress protein n=1 Tax=Marinimicrobium alkaliphilum TaxID=2202654 RepID=UPI001E4FBC7D|nr:universal stress protein [Marinimicrobium alkaliphilum]